MLHKDWILARNGGLGLTNTLSSGDRIVSFLIGQFSLVWIDQQQSLNFNLNVIESEWGRGANLDVLASKLAADPSHSIKAVCIVHNLAAVRKLLGMSEMLLLFCNNGLSLC